MAIGWVSTPVPSKRKNPKCANARMCVIHVTLAGHVVTDRTAVVPVAGIKAKIAVKTNLPRPVANALLASALPKSKNLAPNIPPERVAKAAVLNALLARQRQATAPRTCQRRILGRRPIALPTNFAMTKSITLATGPITSARTKTRIKAVAVDLAHRPKAARSAPAKALAQPDAPKAELQAGGPRTVGLRTVAPRTIAVQAAALQPMAVAHLGQPATVQRNAKTVREPHANLQAVPRGPAKTHAAGRLAKSL